MDKEGHKVLRIVMSRSLTGTLDTLSHAAANWGEVCGVQLSVMRIYLVKSCQLCHNECCHTATQVEHVAARLGSLHGVACCWNLGGAGVYRAQLESRNLHNTRCPVPIVSSAV